MAKILLVDDEEDILFLLEQTFLNAGHTVIATRDPERVLPLARIGRFDAIVLDVMLPKISGWSLLEQLRRQEASQATPVVLLTALSSVSDRVRGLRSGANDYLTKPFEPVELMARVEGLIQRQPSSGASLQGLLEVQSVGDVLQQLEQSRRTGRLEVSCLGDSGVVTLHRGQLISAVHGPLEGEEAVLSLLEVSRGSFRFHAAPETDAETANATASRPLSMPSLLIQSAWIADELAIRRQHLPPVDAILRLARWPQSPPGNLPILSLEVLAPLIEAAPTTLQQLLEQRPFAPNRLLLTLAWLLEEGHLITETPSVATTATGPFEEPQPATAGVAPTEAPTTAGEGGILDTAEALDAALREALQTALYRGLELDRLGLQIHLDGASWCDVSKLLADLPPVPDMAAQALVSPAPAAEAIRHYDLQHDAGRLTISCLPLAGREPVAVPDGGSRHYLGIILWLSEEWAMDDLDRLGRRFLGPYPQAGLIVLCSTPTLRGKSLVRFGAEPGWHVPTRLPSCLAHLLHEVTQCEPGVEAP